jgi:hypothetical protein
MLAELVLNGAAGTLWPVAIGAMALAGVSAAYATTGGTEAIAFGEEMGEPHRRMGHVILLAGLIGALATAFSDRTPTPMQRKRFSPPPHRARHN